jgi:hypothetical protein
VVEVFRLPVVKDVLDAPDAELLLVTVQMQQVAALLPSLARHRAPTVGFLLNANPVPSEWAQALGGRLVLGFPAMLAGYRGDVVAYRTLPGFLRFAIITTLGPPAGHPPEPARALVRLLADARLPAAFSADMHSWLATHSALVTGLFAFTTGRLAERRSLRMSLTDARTVADSLAEGLDLAVTAGAQLVPRSVSLLRYVPSTLVASVFFGLSHIPWFERAVVDYAEHAGDEVRAMYEGLRARAGGSASPNLDRLCAHTAWTRGKDEHEARIAAGT